MAIFTILVMKQKKYNSIGILGCGWLGLPLAKQLVENGFTVRGTTTRKEKLKTITTITPHAYCVRCTEEGCDAIIPFLKGLDLIIVNLPPGLRKNPKRRFDLVIEQLATQIEKNKIKHVIFISSTSVYGNLEGEIDEETKPQPETKSGHQLLRCEQILFNNSHFKTIVLRFGGLIGPNRNPINSLIKKQYIDNPKGLINFIHQTDCIGLIRACIDDFKGNTIYNGVSPYHPNRASFYKKLAALDHLDCPPFISTYENKRYISSKKVQQELNFEFVVENLLTLN